MQFRPTGRGGWRPNAGRKKSPHSGVSHLRRPVLKRRFPVHVTLRMLPHVYQLRSRRSFRIIERAFLFGHERFGFRLAHFSAQGNHLQLICEAEDESALARGIQGLSVRIAKGLNGVMGRSGRVFADRYHARILKTPHEVKNALRYVVHNFAKHMKELGKPIPLDWRDPYSSAWRR